jgi:hypothetical protein
VTSLESSYARIIPDDTAEPTTNVAENHNDVASDVLQAAYLFIRGSQRDHFFNCARAGSFSQALETAPCQIKLAKAIKVLDRRYVSDQCLSVVTVGGTIASAADSHTGASNADLIALEPRRGESNT